MLSLLEPVTTRLELQPKHPLQISKAQAQNILIPLFIGLVHKLRLIHLRLVDKILVVAIKVHTIKILHAKSVPSAESQSKER